MYSSQIATMTSNSNPSFDQLRWVIQIRRTLDEELEDDTGVPVCIFNVPKTLVASKPDCYLPQEVAIGPYHYRRPELYEMERYKVAAAKRTQKQLQNLKFENLVDQLMKHEPRIRACFHKYLDFNGETLAWMVAVDACFLLEFLYVYAIKEDKVLRLPILSTMSHLVDYSGRKSAHNALLRDIVMLENQIPLFLLRKILEVQYSSLDAADDLLHSMLMGLCKEISPLKMIESFPCSIQVSDCAHLLDSLYQIIVPTSKLQSEMTEAPEDQNAPANEDEKFEDSSYVKKLFNERWKLPSKLKEGTIKCLSQALVVVILMYLSTDASGVDVIGKLRLGSQRLWRIQIDSFTGAQSLHVTTSLGVIL
ncbi:putative UPF0481 protein At3g02645 [Macadamia integrifolia]|uniref:putative UPF0481 protein At3g02645 n=1 Tax=Macadamia integrifolia TaxID=60698 RepID=UPI001C4FC946|nr:putative UPF0481 protein At3g02645 [Macadamia integrifolia]